MASADVTPPEDDDFLISESDAQAFATIHRDEEPLSSHYRTANDRSRDGIH